MTTKETKLRIEPDLDQWLASQAAIAGIAKTKYIMQLLEAQRIANQHTHPQLSPKLSSESPADASLYAEVAALKSRVAKLEQGIPKATQTIPKTIPNFEVGQEITGQSAKTYRLLWNSFDAEQKINRTTYYLSNKLGVICKVIGTSKAGKKKLSIWVTFPGDKVVIQDDGTFLTEKSNGKLGWAYEEVKPTLAEPTTPTDVVNDEIAIEAVEVASLPQDEPAVEQLTEVVEPAPSTEPLTLDRAALAQRMAKTPGEAKTFAATLTSVGGAKNKASNILDWTSKHDPEGMSWMPTDETRQTWACQSSVTV